MDELSIEQRLQQISERIDSACSKVGRDPAGVRLLAVTKTFPPEAVDEACRAGLDQMGESRIQEARQKLPLCSSRITWHFIGHLQRNKVREAVEYFSMIHAIDSLRLLEAVDKACAEVGKRLPVLLEVNVSGEASKYGIPPGEVPQILDVAGRFLNVDIAGLMTIPPFSAEQEDARKYFKKLRELRDQWAGSHGFALKELSMGMSHDFEVAIEEGATWIRLGSMIFGNRKYKPAGNDMQEEC